MRINDYSIKVEWKDENGTHSETFHCLPSVKNLVFYNNPRKFESEIDLVELANDIKICKKVKNVTILSNTFELLFSVTV